MPVSNFPRARGLPVEDPMAQWNALIEAQQGRMQQPQAAMYSDEEIAARQEANEREYALGMLAALSGGKAATGVGGLVLKNAIAARQPKVSERGTADQITGRFNYSPDYLRERDEAQLTALERGRADAAMRYSNHLDSEERAERREARADRREARADRRAAGGGDLGVGAAMQIGVDDGGAPVYRQTKTGQLFKYDQGGAPVAHQGQVLPKPSSSQPSEDERKAAGWVAQAKFAMDNVKAARKLDAQAMKPGILETAVGMIPKVGEMGANALRTPGRQKFVQASSSFAEAALRAATGAGVNEQEARQKIAEVTPQLNDSDELIEQKGRAWDMYYQSLVTRAGRAMPTPAKPGPGGGADPLGLLGG